MSIRLFCYSAIRLSRLPFCLFYIAYLLLLLLLLLLVLLLLLLLRLLLLLLLSHEESGTSISNLEPSPRGG